MNARYARRSDPAAGFQQDRSKLFLVPKSAVLQQQWKSLPESDLVWDLGECSDSTTEQRRCLPLSQIARSHSGVLLSVHCISFK